MGVGTSLIPDVASERAETMLSREIIVIIQTASWHRVETPLLSFRIPRFSVNNKPAFLSVLHQNCSTRTCTAGARTKGNPEWVHEHISTEQR